MTHDAYIIDAHHLAVVPDDTIITWQRILGDPTSEAVAFVRRELDPADSLGVVVWVSPGGWDPQTIESAGVTFPCRVVRWGDVSITAYTAPELPALVETLDSGGAWNRGQALECAARVWAGVAAHGDGVRDEYVLESADTFLEWLTRDPLADALNDGIKGVVELPDPDSPEVQEQADAAVRAYQAWERGQTDPSPTDIIRADEDQAPSLGDLAERLRALKSVGATRAALMYAVDRVWWENEQ